MKKAIDDVLARKKVDTIKYIYIFLIYFSIYFCPRIHTGTHPPTSHLVDFGDTKIRWYEVE
jgi:hypothetical protein